MKSTPYYYQWFDLMEIIHAVAQSTGISQWTLSRILDDDERLSLYVDLEPDDDRVADALDGADIDAVDLPEGGGIEEWEAHIIEVFE